MGGHLYHQRRCHYRQRRVIGHGTTILFGVTVGDGAVIAANATVVKDVMPYDVVGGNPAKVIKSRFSGEIKALLLQLAWWGLPVEVIRDINKRLSEAPSVEGVKALLRQYRGDVHRE